jgi:putative transposase
MAADSKAKIIAHIKEYANSKSIHIDHINAVEDHMHALVSLGADQNIATVINLIKGESSHWINQQGIIPDKFSWQDEYFAVSIGESQLETVRQYIRNQVEHHQKKTFQQEYDEFMAKYHFNNEKG